MTTQIRDNFNACKTNRERVLFYLLNHGPITPMRAAMEWHEGHLASRIDELRREGWDIRTTIKYTESGRKYAEYYFTRAQENANARAGLAGRKPTPLGGMRRAA